MLGIERIPATEAILIIEPPPLLIICGMDAFMVKKGQLEDDLGPRLVAMVRNIEASLGLH